MRFPFGYASVVFLLAPSGVFANESCEAPTSAKEQILLQGRAALHFKREGAAEVSEFDDEARKDMKSSERKLERRLHLNSVMEQAFELVRHRAGPDTMAAAGQEMEDIDEKVLPEIMAEHRSSKAALDLQWGVYELAESVVEDEVKQVIAAAEKATKYEADHIACRTKEAAFLEVVEICEKELKLIIEADARSHVAPRSAGAHPPEAPPPSTDASREQAKKNKCEALKAQRKTQRAQCEGDQHSAEEEFCTAHTEAVHARGKLADTYAMALSAYEAATKHIRADEAARRKEFDVVETVRCLKELFLAATKGSVADPAWLDECKVRDSESSELNLSYKEPHAWAYSLQHMSSSPGAMPCAPEFNHARLAKLPHGVKLAPCTLCTLPSDKPISIRSSGHEGHSQGFWFGFHEGVRAASGEDKGSAAHVESFEKKIAAEGAERNFARFHGELSKQILHRLPDEWSASLNQEIHHGFMNGFEAGMDVTAEQEKQRWAAEQKQSEASIDKSLARASQALSKALDMVKAARSNGDSQETKISSGFSTASESAQVLPFGEI